MQCGNWVGKNNTQLAAHHKINDIIFYSTKYAISHIIRYCMDLAIWNKEAATSQWFMEKL